MSSLVITHHDSFKYAFKAFSFQHVAIVAFGNRKMRRCTQTRCHLYLCSLTIVISLWDSSFYRTTLCVSVAFSVVWCPSVFPSCSCIVSTAKDIVKLLFRLGGPIILVVEPQVQIRNSKWNPFSGELNSWGGWDWEFLWFSTEIAVYLGIGKW